MIREQWIILFIIEGFALALWGGQAKEPGVRPGTERISPLLSDPASETRFQLAQLDGLERDFPVNISPVGTASIQWQLQPLDDGSDVFFSMGRFYIWWQGRDAQSGSLYMLELYADNIVVFLQPQDPNEKSWFKGLGAGAQIVPEEFIRGIYLAGDVILTEGTRSIQADELYYDFPNSRALAINATLRTFDTLRNIPIYLRAARLRQESASVFSADDTVLTTSEFNTPQISLCAAKIIVRDSTDADMKAGTLSDDSFTAELQDVRFKVYDRTVLKLPKVKGDMKRPDIPLQGLRLGNDSIWGASVESEWDLPELLGLRQAEGTDSRFHLDYYDKRGPGTGLDVDYQRENYFGRSITYFIHDHGEDYLGRHASRNNIPPPYEERGRFSWQHRHFLPYRWQVTTEVSYLSDKNFLEQYYRGEAQAGKEQETLIHSKRIQDNWGLSLLAKTRTNEFMSPLEELPSAEFNWAGQSLFDGLLTFHSQSLVGRMQQRYDETRTPAGSDEPYTFFSSRNELDLPLTLSNWRLVPYVAGTFGFDDGSGFQVNREGIPVQPEKDVLLGEAGLRIAPPDVWRVDRKVVSRFWDLNQLRHVVSPSLLLVGYAEDKNVAEQRDLVQFGLSQRWQTKRGVGKKQRTVDWLRLDMDFTWLDSSARSGANSNELHWNVPMTPLIDRFSPVDRFSYPSLRAPADRRTVNSFGPNRSYMGVRLAWLLTDTTTLLSDGYYDLMDGIWRRVNVGMARVCWPDLSTYFGMRYMRDTNNQLGQIGSNMCTFSATYRLDPRYALVFSNQYDFEYGENIRSDIALVRRYHRLNYALTFGVDESLDRTSLVFSLWPQGIRDLSLGMSRYMGLGL